MTGFAKLMLGTLLLVALSSGALCSRGGGKPEPAGDPMELAVCGGDSVFILRLAGPDDSEGEIVWSWCAADAPELPDSMRGRFASTDDCKPVDSGRAILITSSSNGVALVERATRKLLFWGTAANAHSADLLPGGLVAVAASHSEDGTGDRLILFAPGTPGEVLESHELSWAHGAVWDNSRQRLYALGDDLVKVFRLNGAGNQARLEEITRIALPETGGHEMFPVPGLPYLMLSTSRHCWLMDRDTGRIVAHPTMGDTANVKCLGIHPGSAQMAWIQAEGDDWWATRIRMRDPENTILMPQRKLYNVRWF